jgi:hypothetical protein
VPSNVQLPFLNRAGSSPSFSITHLRPVFSWGMDRDYWVSGSVKTRFIFGCAGRSTDKNWSAWSGWRQFMKNLSTHNVWFHMATGAMREQPIWTEVPKDKVTFAKSIETIFERGYDPKLKCVRTREKLVGPWSLRRLRFARRWCRFIAGGNIRVTELQCSLLPEASWPSSLPASPELPDRGACISAWDTLGLISHFFPACYFSPASIISQSGISPNSQKPRLFLCRVTDFKDIFEAELPSLCWRNPWVRESKSYRRFRIHIDHPTPFPQTPVSKRMFLDFPLPPSHVIRIRCIRSLCSLLLPSICKWSRTEKMLGSR